MDHDEVHRLGKHRMPLPGVRPKNPLLAERYDQQNEALPFDGHGLPETGHADLRDDRRRSAWEPSRDAFTIEPIGLSEPLGETHLLELNGQVVPRQDFSKAHLRDGDNLEVVTLVGGG